MDIIKVGILGVAAVLMAIAVSVILVLVEWWNERQESSE